MYIQPQSLFHITFTHSCLEYSTAMAWNGIVSACIQGIYTNVNCRMTFFFDVSLHHYGMYMYRPIGNMNNETSPNPISIPCASAFLSSQWQTEETESRITRIIQGTV